MSRREAPYARVSPGFWRDSKRHQWTSDATMLGIYLLTCEHKTTEGLFALPLEYARADLPGLWSIPKIKRALGELEAHGFAYYDHDSGVVLLSEAMKIQRPDAPGQRTAAKRKLAALPATSLWPRFLQAAEMHAPDFHKELEEEVLDGMYPDMQDAMVHSLALALAPTLSPAPAPTLAPTPTHTQNSKLKTQNSSSIAQDSTTQGSDSSVSVSPEPSVDNESKVTPLTTDLLSSSEVNTVRPSSSEVNPGGSTDETGTVTRVRCLDQLSRLRLQQRLALMGAASPTATRSGFEGVTS